MLVMQNLISLPRTPSGGIQGSSWIPDLRYAPSGMTNLDARKNGWMNFSEKHK